MKSVITKQLRKGSIITNLMTKIFQKIPIPQLIPLKCILLKGIEHFF